MIRLIVGLGMLFMGGTAMAQGGCDQPVSGADLARHISKADVAFAQMNAEAFRAARWEADRAIPCMGEAVQVGQAAAFYRMQALGAFMDQDHARTVGWFKSVFAVAPQYVLPETLAPEGHPLRIDFEVAQGMPPMRGEAIPRPALGLIRVDGKVGVELPKDRPYLWQWADTDGRARRTAVVRPGQAPPRYATVRGVQSLPRNRSRGRATQAKRMKPAGISVPLVIVAGSAAIVSGVSYGVASSKAQRFWSRSTPNGQLPDLRQQTNTWAWVSVGAGAVAVGTGAGAVISGTW